jgi:prolipoprotein diacylglyceryltransferase
MFVLPPIPNAAGVHALFETAALLVGTQAYWLARHRAGQPSAFSGVPFAILMGALLGAGLGSKAVFWLERPDLLAQAATQPPALLFASGQSIVGGLLGGLLGVELAKKMNGVTASTGDLFVGPILLGLVVGRVGCVLAGLADDTYGVPTGLPWGVDFGDGVPRHPTQLYEILFAAALWLALNRAAPRFAVVPGLKFRLMLSAYLLWRLFIDGLKPVPVVFPGGLSGIQWACLLALALYLPGTVRRFRNLP